MSARKKRTEKLDVEILRQRLKLKNFELKKNFSDKYPQADRFFRDKGADLSKIREHSAKLLGTGLVAGSLFFLSPADELKLLSPPHELVEKFKSEKNINIVDKNKLLVDTLSSVLSDKPKPLTRSEEKFLEQLFLNVYGISARASLEGERLNTSYGYIGAEQHLRRFPGDTLAMHGEGKVLKEGMAPGLSAWGYFAATKEDLSPEVEEIEKWYAVVQTLYLPNWNVRQPYLKDWYKYRKVLIVNTQNGKAIVAAVADSGPASWTGKQFGGSPEVMDYLGGERYKKGKVLLYFVDDPENNVPLGPVETREELGSVLTQNKTL